MSNKIELSPELTKKAVDIGATHYSVDDRGTSFLKIAGNSVMFHSVDDMWHEYLGCTAKEILDQYTVFEIDFDPPKLVLMAEIDRLNAELLSSSADAARYRFIRKGGGRNLEYIAIVQHKHGGRTRELCHLYADEEIDEAVKNSPSDPSKARYYLPM